MEDPKPSLLGKISPRTRRRVGLGAVGVFTVSLAVVLGYRAAENKGKGAEAAATRAWHGTIGKIARSGADKTGGVTIRKDTSAASPATEGAEIGAGVEIVTDERTRARLDLDDGTSVVLDRGTKLRIEAAPRTMRIDAGSLIADVAHIEGAPPARLATENGEASVLGTKLALTATDDRTTVEVLRGLVELKDASSSTARIGAGQEGVIAKHAKMEIAPVNDLAQRVAFGERLGLPGVHNEDADLPVSGLGELRARRPGKTDEKDHAVALTSHQVKVRIAGNVARTEIDETFANDTGDDLEGVYRFPLPPGAEIEKLALEVDGKLIDGAFVDKAKGAAIFRGAIHNAVPTAPKPKEEIFWVPGPWRDPALLEWQRGGRFELKIFPIPKHGSRRVVLAYTETVAPVGGVRRYVYPLPQSTASDLRIGQFGVDVQVLGADPKSDVRVRGYELAKTASEGGAARFAQSFTSFVPTGDLSVEYALADRTTDVTAWGYTDVGAPAPAPLPGAPGDTKHLAVDTSYVALALRPKLPGWTDPKPRDVVLVVDAGRSMFGERFQRARRLAVQLTQEMDRRDRVALLACDVTCRAMPGGFDGAGSGRAHDVDGFLASTEPDGASDLVGAVRAAEGLGGHERARDLRVVLISDGVASAGYRRPDRLAREVKDTLADPRDEVVTVPIGGDTDVVALAEIARGGGGVVAPYAPGEALESAALDVLNATYGVTLRDVELTLPPGLTDVAPAALAPMRAGSETIVAARMTGGDVHGDVILRGKVGGEPFEARYPVDVRATSDAGNAFVPRLFAAARIADRERGPDASSPAARAELVGLSQRFAVPSKFTSLLVLESEAMFTAFGIDRGTRAAGWTGDTLATGTEVATKSDSAGADDERERDIDDLRSEEKKKEANLDGVSGKGAGGGGAGEGFGGGRRGGALAGPLGDPLSSSLGGATQAPPAKAADAPRPSPTTAPMAPPPPAAQGHASEPVHPSRPRLDDPNPWAEGLTAGPSNRGRWMKRVWVRHATLTASGGPAIPAERVATARAAVQAAPDERAKYKDLVRLLSANGALDELGEVLARWSSRDPLDEGAIAARADLAARAGDRPRALRILGGVAQANADAATLDTLALASERGGERGAACAFRIASAEVDAEAGRSDPTRIGRAVACERVDGRAASADRWLEGAKDRAAAEAAATRAEAVARGSAVPTENVGFGDIVVDATWDAAAGVDVDLAVVDPSGTRLAWASRARGVRVADGTSKHHETLAVSSGLAGPYTVELVRGGGSTAAVPVTLAIRAAGEHMTTTEQLAGPSVAAARVQVRYEQELVEVAGPVVNAPPFDRASIARALSSVQTIRCAGRQSGDGVARVTFAPSGQVVQVSIASPLLEGTWTAGCVSNLYRALHVPAYDPTQGNVTVSKSFVVPP